MSSKKLANDKYHKKLKSVILKFNPDNEIDMLVFKRIQSQSSMKGYITKLVSEDINCEKRRN